MAFLKEGRERVDDIVQRSNAWYPVGSMTSRLLAALNAQANELYPAYEVWPNEFVFALPQSLDSMGKVKFVVATLLSLNIHAVSEHLNLDEVVSI